MLQMRSWTSVRRSLSRYHWLLRSCIIRSMNSRKSSNWNSLGPTMIVFISSKGRIRKLPCTPEDFKNFTKKLERISWLNFWCWSENSQLKSADITTSLRFKCNPKQWAQPLDFVPWRLNLFIRSCLRECLFSLGLNKVRVCGRRLRSEFKGMEQWLDYKMSWAAKV